MQYRDSEKRKWWEEGVVTDTTFYGKKHKFPALEVPRQCPLVLLVKHSVST
jgi:hypothetical protein